jgi:hypothetical protein
MKGDELLVGGDDALAGSSARRTQVAGGIEAAGQFDHHIDIGSEHRVGVFAPHDGSSRHPVRRACVQRCD